MPLGFQEDFQLIFLFSLLGLKSSQRLSNDADSYSDTFSTYSEEVGDRVSYRGLRRLQEVIYFSY